MRIRMLATLCGLAMVSWAGTAKAIPVDLELSLVIDGSGSISNGDFEQQIRGYANAFRQGPVVQSIVNSTKGIAVNAILFAGFAEEPIPFRRLQTAQQVDDFARDLDGITRNLRVNNGTNIAAGIKAAADAIIDNNFESSNLIIDVSGDGAQNIGNAADARADALADGVSQINAIAVGSRSLLGFFESNVIGNLPTAPKAFALQADSFDDFDAAIIKKLGIELGIEPESPVSVPEPGALSMIGFGFLALGFAMRRRRSA